MKEKLHNQPEVGREHLPNAREVVETRNETLAPTAESTEVHNHSIDKLQESIHEVALSAEEVAIEQPDRKTTGQSPFGLQRELKRDAYTKTLRKVHGQLAPVERTFSKLIHHKAVEPVSEISSKTIARPSGILGSGITALIGSIVVLFMARYYGFEYNLSIFFILLGVGFLVGILVEFAGHFLKRRKA